MTPLDPERRALVRLSAAIAGAGEDVMREALGDAARHVRQEWVEEVVLQSYLFAGFPRALNAAREWRRVSGLAAPENDEGERYDSVPLWEERGQNTCAIVYGPFYDALRRNIRKLHPALDTWMIVDGYGKVLSRPQLDLALRELCVIAACALARQDRQLHSHLYGALHSGAGADDITGTLDALSDLLSDDDLKRYRSLWAKVRSQHSSESAHSSARSVTSSY